MDICRICRKEQQMKKVIAREMMFGMREEFSYMICPECGCLQIETIPDNLGDYYGEDYYSYQERKGTEAVIDEKKKDMTRILDVGCGSGEMLCNMAQNGMGNLTGCDPFLKKDIVYGNGVRIYKRTIHEMEGEYDYIFLNDSFEHMTDPHEVMDSIKRLLAPKGIARIRIPVFPNIAWDLFGVNWYQLDAPRHLYLHSRESMKLLVQEHGLQIVSIQYDSSVSQIVCSYLYEKDVPLNEQNEEYVKRYFNQQSLLEISENVQTANKNGYGDHAAFFIMKLE